MRNILIIVVSLFPFTINAQWMQQNSNTSVYLNSIFFPSDSIGYILGENSHLLKTINGGATWNSIGPLSIYGSLYFTSNDTGYATGPGGIFKTTNGGVSWTDNFTDSVGAGSIHFPTKNIGYSLCVNNAFDSILVYKTINAGLNWNRISGFPSGGIGGSVFFINTTVGFMTVNGDGIFKTSDGGVHWQKKSGSSDLNSIYFPSDSIGYAVGDSIFKTTDAGNTWHLQYNPNSTLFYSVYFTDTNTGYVVGGDGFNTGVIVKTIDGGVNWTLSLSNTYTFSSVHFPSTNIGYVCGQGGKIYKYGLSTDINNYAEINSLSIFPNPGNGKFNLSFGYFNKSCKVSILDILGNTVQQFEMSNPILNIDISTEPKGIYFVKLENEQVVKMAKIIYQ